MTKSRQLSDDAVRLIGTVTYMVNLDGSPWNQWMVGTYSDDTNSLFDRPEIRTKGRGELWFGNARDREEAADVTGILIDRGCKLDDKSDPTGHKLYFVRREKKRRGSSEQQPYSSVDHVREAGLKVVADFARFKSVTKRTADRGREAEDLIRAALRAVLPGWIGVKQGFVIDSYGHTSLQQDIVLFEQGHSPVFRTPTDVDAGNFPCECVIAAGEVKSLTYRGWVRDMFEKSASAKRMRRALRQETVSGNSWFPWRHYGTRATDREEHARGAMFDQDRNGIDRIMTFGVAVESPNRPSTIARQVAEQLEVQEHAMGPDTIVILQRGVVEARRTFRESDKVSRSEILGLQDERAKLTSMQEWNDDGTKLWDPFSYLVTKILEHAYTGRTSHEAALLRYMSRMGWAMSGFHESTHPISRQKRS